MKKTLLFFILLLSFSPSETFANLTLDKTEKTHAKNTNTLETFSAPRVISITRHNPTEENTIASEVSFKVTFNKPVKNVDANDFELVSAIGGTITNVTSLSSSEYLVEVGSIIQATGTIELKVKGVNTTGTNDIIEVIISETETITQNATDDYLNQATLGQTFTATTSDLLTSLSIFKKLGDHNFDGTAELKLFSGNPNTGGVQLGNTQNISINSTNGEQKILLETPVDLTAGNEYSFTLSDFTGTGNHALESNKTVSYTGGKVIFTGQNASHNDFDLKFKIFEGTIADGVALSTTVPITIETYSHLANRISLTENFNGDETPQDWNNTASSGNGWEFSTGADFNASSVNDHTNNGGNYAWVDFSGTDTNVVLELPTVDISSFNTPVLSFFHFSHYTGTLATYNILYIEAWNGTNYDVIATLQGDNGSANWFIRNYQLASHTYNTNLVKIRFRAESGGDSEDYYNDILIDDITITDISIPTIITNNPTNITPNQATITGNVTFNGGVTVTERGIVYAKTAINYDPRINGADVTKIVKESGVGEFSQTITNLEPNTQYSYTTYATNSLGTAYGQTIAFTTFEEVKVTAITRENPSAENTLASEVVYNVGFNKDVKYVDTNDFTTTGDATGDISLVTKINDKNYTVTVNNLSGEGALKLQIKGVNGINGTNDIKESIPQEIETINQIQTNDYLNHSKIGQTFTATSSGTLTKVTFFPKQGEHSFIGTANLLVYDGDETTGGSLLTTESVNITNIANVQGQSFSFSVPQNLTQGNVYSIVLTNFSGGGNLAIASNTSGGYTSGRAIFTGQTAAHNNFDLKIKIYETFKADRFSLATTAPTTHENYYLIGYAALTTSSPTTTALNEITLGGEITSAKGGIISERGIIYAETTTNATPTIGSNGVIKKDIGTGIGEYSEAITGLDPNTNFSYRAYAINEKGTAYGEIKTFTISATLTTNDVSFINTKLYPNPVKSHLTIVTETNIEKIIIYNLLGKEIYTQKVQSRITEIPFNQFKAGIYLVKIQGEKNSTTQKVIKL